jgi:ketopantoate reductase
LILGAGGLGGYCGGMLLMGGAYVALLARPRRAAQLVARGLAAKNPEGDFVTPVKALLAGEIDGRMTSFYCPARLTISTARSRRFAPAVGPQARLYRR